MNIIHSFDNSTEEILKPSHIAKPVESFPETVIVTFSQRLISPLLDGSEEMISSMNAGEGIPVYKIMYKNTPIACYRTQIGAPVTVGLMEEMIIKGGKKFLLYGSCGSLDRRITDGHIIVPTSAYRDEGTSYHYAPADRCYIEVKTAKRMAEILRELNIPYIEGKTWTTDAFFRETKKNMEARKKEGCLTVEMECASVMAMADFRKVEAYQFLYTADNLGGAEWEARLLSNTSEDFRKQIANIALEAAIRL